MIGLLCGATAKNNEEYKKVIHKRLKRFCLLGLLGIITMVVAFLAHYKLETEINSHMIGLYLGVGTGITIAAFVMWIKNRILLTNEDKLTESRLEHVDERIKEINTRAIKAATFTLLIALYMVGLIGGLFYPILVKVLCGLVFIFTIAYSGAYKFYEKQM